MFSRASLLLSTFILAALRTAPAPAFAVSPPASADKPSGTAAPQPASPRTPAAAARPRVLDLATRDDFAKVFNGAKGKVRIVAFLSPTCGHCMANAQALQETVLEKVVDPDLSICAVWIKALDTDSKERIQYSRQVLSDPRVQHLWDPGHRLNAMLLDAVGFDIQLRFYDVFLLYDRNAVWEKRLPRPGFWMHETRGAPGPRFDASGFAVQVQKALAGQPLDTPRP